MNESVGTSGLIFNEPLLWEKGATGRTGFSMPRRDIEAADLDDRLAGGGPDFPDLSELAVIRHFTRLSQWNFGVDSGIYPLGSCTMKYNPKTNERQAALPGFAGAHPLLPSSLSQGVLKMMFDLEEYLSEITGLPAATLQPAAGSHGELTGMMIFYAYHKRKGAPRSKVLIPDTAHGTNPASAALCGFKAVAVKSNKEGILSPETIDGVKVKDIDKKDGFRFILEDNSWLLVRFSGTEAVLRIYAESDSMARVERLLELGKGLAGVSG